MSDAFPMQPLIKDQQGVVRFQKNAVVEYLLDHGGIDLNRLALERLPDAARAHFAQLIGYSLCGYHELPYVTDEQALAASAAARQQWPDAGGCRDGEGCTIHSDRYQGEEAEEE